MPKAKVMLLRPESKINSMKLFSSTHSLWRTKKKTKKIVTKHSQNYFLCVADLVVAALSNFVLVKCQREHQANTYSTHSQIFADTMEHPSHEIHKFVRKYKYVYDNNKIFQCHRAGSLSRRTQTKKKSQRRKRRKEKKKKMRRKI